MVVSFQFPQDGGHTGDHLTGERKRDLVSCSDGGPYCISMISMSSTIDLKTLVGIRERCRVNVPISFNFRKGSSPTSSAMSSYSILAKLTFRPFSGEYVSQEPNGSQRTKPIKACPQNRKFSRFVSCNSWSKQSSEILARLNLLDFPLGCHGSRVRFLCLGREGGQTNQHSFRCCNTRPWYVLWVTLIVIKSNSSRGIHNEAHVIDLQLWSRVIPVHQQIFQRWMATRYYKNRQLIALPPIQVRFWNVLNKRFVLTIQRD